MKFPFGLVSLLLACSFSAGAQQVSLNDPSQLSLTNAKAELTTHRGSTALKLVPSDSKINGGLLALFNGIRFRNGVIDVDVSGMPAKGADESARGFIGVVFRAQSAKRFEIIYLRPTNSHADDQLPAQPHYAVFFRSPTGRGTGLGKESPGVYESWADHCRRRMDAYADCGARNQCISVRQWLPQFVPHHS